MCPGRTLSDHFIAGLGHSLIAPDDWPGGISGCLPGDQREKLHRHCGVGYSCHVSPPTFFNL